MTFDPFCASFVRNPYEHYRALRNRREALWSPLLRAWLLTRYADVRAVLSDSDHFSSDDRIAKQPLVKKRGTPGPNIISTDCPDHTRLRRAVAMHFTREAVESWKPRIARALATMVGGGVNGMDVIQDVAVPFPIAVMADALGVADRDRERFARWLDDDITAITAATPPLEVERIHRSSECVHSYCANLIARARLGEGGAGDCLDSLVNDRRNGVELSDAELESFVVLLLRASSSTVTNLIGNGMLALVRNPEQRDLLRRNPGLWEGAFDELVRYDPPVQSIFRIVRRPITVHGVSLERGDRVHVVLASANRDENMFENPDELQLTRDCKDQLAFGAGMHYCLGASLARLQVTMALQSVLERIPDPVLVGGDEAITYAWSWTLRGLASLSIRNRDHASLLG